MSIFNPDKELTWLKELPKEEIEKNLTLDIKMIYEACGMDVLVILWKNLGGLQFYLSEAPLMELKKIYARKFYHSGPDGNNAKQLAVTLGVTDRFIFSAQVDKNGSLPDDPKLFPEL